jgi:hypothetical protein
MKKQEQKTYSLMREITVKDYLKFLKNNEFVIVEDQKVKLYKQWSINYLLTGI